MINFNLELNRLSTFKHNRQGKRSDKILKIKKTKKKE